MTNSTDSILGTGIIPPLVTPLTPERKLDPAGMSRLVESLIDAGIHGLFVLGTTGEGPALSRSMRQQVVSQCVDLAGGRVPVYVGITDSCIDEVIGLAEYSASPPHPTAR